MCFSHNQCDLDIAIKEQNLEGIHSVLFDENITNLRFSQNVFLYAKKL